MYLFLIILIEGFITISIEILSIRQLIPFVGTSVIVTSLIIGVFLLFLALGYWRGGIYNKNLPVKLRNNFIISALLIGIGFAYPIIDYFFILFFKYNIVNVLIPLCAYLLLIIAPTVYLLGQTVPITMNMFKSKKSAGAIGGKTLFLSTLGSFAGALITSLVLIEFLGVAWTVFINYAALVALVAILYLMATKDIEHLMHLLILLFVGIIVFYLNVNFANSYFVANNNYANYHVSKHFIMPQTKNHGRLLQINNSLSSYIDKNLNGFPYIATIRKILFNGLKLTHKNILVLGAGGFTLSAKSAHNNHFTYVDIDKNIAKIVKKSFLGKINGKFIGEDARVFLLNSKAHYDVIVGDTYNQSNAIPAALVTYDYFLQIRRSLTKNGIAIFNIIANPMLNDNYSKRIDSTIRAVFPNCMSNPLHYGNELTNIIYICHKSDQEHDSAVYSDNKSTATIDQFNN